MNEPRRGPFMMQFAGSVVIFPWIGGRQPMVNILLQYVTCKAIAVISGRNGNVGYHD
jgi:hypothetical protein